jgi:hypothetical protein
MTRIRMAGLTALTGLALTLTATHANAQIGVFPPIPGQPVPPGFGVGPGVPWGPFPGSPVIGGPLGGSDAAFVQSLYWQYLGRYPDPRGFRTWLNRLAQFGGDRHRLTQEFILAAQRELNANNPYSPWNRGRW